MRSVRAIVTALCLVATIACGEAPSDPAASLDDDAGAATGTTPGDDAGTPDARASDAATPTHDGGHADAAPDSGAKPPPPPPPPPDIDTIPWETSGADVGFGTAFKDTGNPLGTSVFIGYAGYNVDATAARAWVTALYRAALVQRGVRYVWAVQGPSNATYTQQEIGNSHVARALVSRTNAQTKFILVAGHSSGSFVAHELLGQLAGGSDPGNVTSISTAARRGYRPRSSHGYVAPTSSDRTTARTGRRRPTPATCGPPPRRSDRAGTTRTTRRPRAARRARRGAFTSRSSRRGRMTPTTRALPRTTRTS